MNVLPSNNEDYKDQSYWEERYKHEDSFDWFTSYSAFRKYIFEDVKFNDSILMLGCGNSTMSAEMYNDGFHHITNMDYSEVVIDNMQHKHRHMNDMQWVVMDMMDMGLPMESFDVMIEKGTLDAMLVDEKDPWYMTEEAENTMDCILSQVSKILKPGGRFISVTFAQPHFRKPLYAQTQYDWDVQLNIFGESFHFFYYVMTKGNELSEADKKLELEHKSRLREPPHVDSVTESEDETFLNHIDVG